MDTMQNRGFKTIIKDNKSQARKDQQLKNIASDLSNYTFTLPEGVTAHLDKEDFKQLIKSKVAFGHYITPEEWERIAADSFHVKPSLPPIPQECECGAKHTSNPNWHMQYCPLSK